MCVYASDTNKTFVIAETMYYLSKTMYYNIQTQQLVCHWINVIQSGSFSYNKQY